MQFCKSFTKFTKAFLNQPFSLSPDTDRDEPAALSQHDVSVKITSSRIAADLAVTHGKTSKPVHHIIWTIYF